MKRRIGTRMPSVIIAVISTFSLMTSGLAEASEVTESAVATGVSGADTERSASANLSDKAAVSTESRASAGARSEQGDPASVPTERADMETVPLAIQKTTYACYRIPSLVQATNGDILAAYDGRPGYCGDSPNPNSIVLRISHDNGKSWDSPTEIVTGKQGVNPYGFSDPSMIVNQKTGRIHAFFTKSYDASFQHSVAGTDPADRKVLHAATVYSDDNGATWSEPRILTKDITGDTGAISRFAASGAGIQLKYGEHAGRLVQQYTIKLANGTYQAMSVYSDDDGATWQAGTPFGTYMDENKVVELSDGRLMVNSRPSGGENYRRIVISDDGGQTYGDVYVEKQLPDPRDNASIIRAYPDAPEGSARARVLLYSSASPQGRVNGLLRISYDDGRTWSAGKQFTTGNMSYSTLSALKDGSYGLFFEGHDMDDPMRFTRFHMSWLDTGMIIGDAVVENPVRGETTLSYTLTNLGSDTVKNATLTPQVPQGWSAAPLTIDALPSGATATFTTQLTIPAGAPADTYQLRGTLTGGTESGEQNRVAAISGAVTLSSEGAPHALRATLAHPLPEETTVPLDIDLVMDSPHTLGAVGITPRRDGAAQGIIRTAELWIGSDPEHLTKVDEGTFPRSAETAYLYSSSTEPAAYVRVRVTSTYGSQDAQANRFLSAAELALYDAGESTTPAPHENTPQAPAPDPQPHSTDPEMHTGSSEGGTIAGIIAGVCAALAGIFALLGAGIHILPVWLVPRG